jgi:hypothetical protein
MKTASFTSWLFGPGVDPQSFAWDDENKLHCNIIYTIISVSEINMVAHNLGDAPHISKDSVGEQKYLNFIKVQRLFYCSGA